MTFTKIFLAILLFAVGTVQAPNWSAHAQSWPTKPIRIVIAFAPGGATDVAVRSASDVASQALGQPLVIENRPGASGAVAADAVARSPADGYTLLATADVMASTPHMFKLNFDPFRDFAPVIQLSLQPVVLAVHPSLGVGSVAEFVAAARAKPGLPFATSGAGSQQHFTAEWFARDAGLKLTHVPYKGGGQAIVDLLAGQVQVGSLGSTPLMPHYRAGKLKILAQSTKARSSALPDVPTYEEAGYKGLVIDQWLAMFAPAGTPREVVLRLNAEFGKALASPGVRERYASAALDPVGGTPEHLAKVLRDDFEKYGRLVKELNVKVD
jgi:tripartite-type tricarboxylate transporter receptor subunit TctC